MSVSRRALFPAALAVPLAACAPFVRTPAAPPLPATAPPPARPAHPAHREPPELSAAAVLVLEPSTGRILLERGADDPRPVASTTKIMTALVALERVPENQLDVPFGVGVMRPRHGETLMGLRSRQQVTVRQLLHGLLLPSGNDAADALATHVAGSHERFVALMNARGAELGLTNTKFLNPSGLDQEGAHSTARDLAALALHALRHPTFAHIAAQRTYVLPHTEGLPEDEAGRTLINNSLPIHIYPGVSGVKPGWTPAAGTCQVISVTLDERSVVAVILKTDPPARDMLRILDWVYGTTSELVPPDHDRTVIRGSSPEGDPWAFFAASRERVTGAFLRAFDQFGGLDHLGYPTGPQRTEGGGLIQHFQHARLEQRAGTAVALTQPAEFTLSAAPDGS